MKLESAETIKAQPVNTKWPVARIENELLEIERQLTAGRGLTRTDRQRLQLMKRTMQWALKLKKRLASPPDVINEKKAHRMKAVARKLRWLAGKDFHSLSPEARRAAERLLRSKLAGEILRAWGCEPAPSK